MSVEEGVDGLKLNWIEIEFVVKKLARLDLIKLQVLFVLFGGKGVSIDPSQFLMLFKSVDKLIHSQSHFDGQLNLCIQY